jgi:hypothetical protein
LKTQVVSAKGKKTLVDLVWTEFEKPSSEIRGNRLVEAVAPDVRMACSAEKIKLEMLKVAVATSPET